MKKREAPAPAETVREDYDANEWGNIGNPESFSKSNYSYAKTEKLRKQRSLLNKDPKWRQKIKHANNNWSQERREAYKNRDKSYMDKNSEWYKNQVERNKKSRIPVRVKQPGKDWVEYKSVRDFALTTDDAGMFEGNPAYYFPKDMSVKIVKHKKSSYCGWEFQRLKEKQW